MKFNQDLIKEISIRFFIISFLIIVAGYIFYSESVFIPTRWASQFFSTGITLGIASSMFFFKRYREGAALLFVWYLILVIFFSTHNPWIFILDAVYTSIMGLTVYFYFKIIRTSAEINTIVRILFAAMFISIANGIIIIVLGMFVPLASFYESSRMLEIIIFNSQIGFGLGLLMGIGAELANIVLNYRIASRSPNL